MCFVIIRTAYWHWIFTPVRQKIFYSDSYRDFLLSTGKFLYICGDFIGQVRYNRHQIFLTISTVAKFVVPDWRDIVDSGMGLLSYRPARLHRLAGRYDNLMPESTISPSLGLRIGPQHGDCYCKSDSGSVVAVYGSAYGRVCQFFCCFQDFFSKDLFNLTKVA